MFYEMVVLGFFILDFELVCQCQVEGCMVILCEVKVSILDVICVVYVEGLIYFFKIDVEGLEGVVFCGFDLNCWCLWLIFVEILFDYDFEWKVLLFVVGYCFVYFDGFNGYYLVEEQVCLEGVFVLLLNLLDDFQFCYGYVMSYLVVLLEQVLEQVL